MKPVIEATCCLAAALVFMFGGVLFGLASTWNPLWIVPAMGCVAVAAYACAALYTLLFFPGLRHR